MIIEGALLVRPHSAEELTKILNWAADTHIEMGLAELALEGKVGLTVVKESEEVAAKLLTSP